MNHKNEFLKATAGFLTLLGIVMALAYPTVKFWPKAIHLAENGVFETVTVIREYEKIIREEAAEGVGKSQRLELSIFRYGPDKDFEAETNTTPDRKTGMAFEIVYNPEAPEEFVVEPRNRTPLGIFLSTPGVTLRILMLLLGFFILFVYLFFLAVSIFQPPSQKGVIS